MSTPPRCSTCCHWRPLGPHLTLRADSPIGECRARPPVRDFAWPRATERDYCGEWKARQTPLPDAQPAPAGSAPASQKGTSAPLTTGQGDIEGLSLPPCEPDNRPRRERARRGD